MHTYICICMSIYMYAHALENTTNTKKRPWQIIEFVYLCHTVCNYRVWSKDGGECGE